MILLDTDIVSHVLRKNAPPRLLRRLRRVPPLQRFLSAITVGEILYGVERTGRHEAIRERLEAHFISRVEVLPFDLAAARVYSRLRAHLHGLGQPLDEPDLRIAAIAISNGLTLISGNESHFRRVPRLKIENWLT
jgi:tRNA(fMet)-specific endonuclease VapC